MVPATFLHLFFIVCLGFCGVEEVVEHLHNNYEYWKAQEEVSQKELMERDGHMIQEEQNHTVEGKS